MISLNVTDRKKRKKDIIKPIDIRANIFIIKKPVILRIDFP